MFIVHVFIHVRPEHVEAFKGATIENAQHSIQEPGILRFDFLQQNDDPHRFTLVEVYRTPDDPARHKETAHYKKWAETVQDMLVEPRSRIIYSNIYPKDDSWA
ncbi:antibiotic biosynthesis monooxygenase [candidate division KSB1 bacterium]|nr:antibiotic biosynthesis monooxygenase [candidate division KSB1 bacterium]